MKKQIIAVLALACVGLSACGNTAESAEPKITSAAETTTTTTAETTAKTTTTEPTTTTKSELNYEAESQNHLSFARSLSEHFIKYSEEQKAYIVMFKLNDNNNKNTAGSGTARVTIKDEQENILYNKSVEFSEEDFITWHTETTEDLCYVLTIKDKDIESATSTSGTLTLKVFGEYFTSEDISVDIYDLPQKSADIILPDTPTTIMDESFSSHISYITINDISYETKYSSNGKMTLYLNVDILLDQKIGEENTADSVSVGYRIIDSQGYVADSGIIYSDALRPGEKTKAKQNIYDLDSSETYTLTLENVT